MAPKKQKLVPLQYRDKLKQLVKRSPQFRIIQGDHFLYFAVQPAQEEVTHREVIKTSKIACYSVTNSKLVVIGYFVVFAGKPKMTLAEFGAALFYTETSQHKRIKMLYSDQKLRVLSFDQKDYFVSVKWKSTSQEE